MAREASSVARVVNRGAGGVDELAAAIPSDEVTWSLLKFQVGSGTFARTKFLCMHNNLESISVIKRGRTNAKGGAVKGAMGSVHAELTVSELEEVTLDHVLEEMLKVVVSDKIGDAAGEFSISQLKKDYEAMLVVQQAAALKLESNDSGTRKTVAEMGEDFMSAMKALNSVKDEAGPLNWILLKAQDGGPKLHDAGSLGVKELQEHLSESEVLFGMVRMTFGAGDFKRQKWLFVSSVPDGVGAVKRGRAMACEKTLKGHLAPTSVDFHVTTREDFGVAEVVEKVKRSVVIDGETKGDDATDPFSLEAYLAGLEEEAKASAALFGDTGGGGKSSATEYDVEESLKLIHDDAGGVSWILMAPK